MLPALHVVPLFVAPFPHDGSCWAHGLDEMGATEVMSHSKVSVLAPVTAAATTSRCSEPKVAA